MRLKLFLFFLIFLISVSFINANIYEFMEFVEANPEQVTIAVDDQASPELIAVTSELAGEFGITSSIFISEIMNEQYLIIVQTNDEEKAIMRFGNQRLSILGNEEAVIEAVEYIKEYKKHKRALSVDDYFFKKKSKILPFIIIVIVLVGIGFVIWYFFGRKKPFVQKPIQPTKIQTQRVVKPQPRMRPQQPKQVQRPVQPQRMKQPSQKQAQYMKLINQIQQKSKLKKNVRK